MVATEIGGRAAVSRDRAVVWWLALDSIGPRDWPQLRALLAAEERARADRFHFERDALVYTAAHALCRGLLSAATGLRPEGWDFSVGAHGKPEVVSPSDGPPLRVNISHTRGLAAVALTVEHDIGVDVEWLDRSPNVDELAGRMFAEREREQLAAMSDAPKIEAFLRFWTRKEAYVKAIGKGLSQPLDAFFFELDQPGIHFADPGADDPARWHFDEVRPGPEHLLALAISHPEPARLSVEIGPAPLAYLTSLAAEVSSSAGEPDKMSRR